MESNCCHLVYLRMRLLLLVGSRWNMFHMEPDFFMPRNNLASQTDFGFFSKEEKQESKQIEYSAPEREILCSQAS